MAAKQQHLLIDGYNLIKSSQLFHRSGQNLAQARLALQQALDAHGHRRQIEITLYYDGDGDDERARQGRYRDIQIVFSRSPETADDLIMRAAQEKHGAKWLRVISSDREIRRFAERHKISSTSSESFLDELDMAQSVAEHAPQQIDPEHSARQMTPEELDEWEQLFSAQKTTPPKPPPQQANDGTAIDPGLDKSELDEWEQLFKRGKRNR